MKNLMLVALLCLTGCVTQNVQQDADESAHRAQLHTELGAAYYGQARMGVALDEFTKAIKIDDRYAPAYAGLGLVHAALRQDDKAESNFKHALSLDATDSNTHNNYGTFLCSRDRIDEAIKEFMTAVSNPLYATPESAYENAGICALKKDDEKAAEGYFLQALRIRPDRYQSALQLAKLYFKRGDHLGARTYLEQAMQHVDPTPEMLWLGVRNEHSLGGKDAEASYRLLLRNKFPDSEETKAMLAE